MKDKMFTTIQKLKTYNGSDFPILTIYLGRADKKTFNAEVIVAQFHSLIHQALDEKEQKRFKKDIERITHFLREQYDSRGKKSIVFFTAGENLWEIIDFEFYLPPLCVILHSPYLKPILEAFDTYTKYLVLLIDRKKAQMFTVHLGQIEEHTDVFDGQVPQKVKHGDDTWDAQDKIFRHIEDHLHRHLKLIAHATSEFVKDKNVHFIILGGHKELFTKVKNHLPDHLRKMVLGEFVTELNIPLNTVFLKSKKIVEELEQDKETKRMEVSLQ